MEVIVDIQTSLCNYCSSIFTKLGRQYNANANAYISRWFVVLKSIFTWLHFGYCKVFNCIFSHANVDNHRDVKLQSWELWVSFSRSVPNKGNFNIYCRILSRHVNKPTISHNHTGEFIAFESDKISIWKY